MTTANITAVLPSSQILTPADGESYEKSLLRWSETGVKRAKYVILPKSSQEVAHAILFATANKLEVAIKGGGHSCYGSSSSNDLVIDLANLNSVVVDAAKQLITVGGGALWSAVDEEAAKHGLAAVGGTVNHTGVGGLTVGGGYGWLCGKHGLVIDNLIEAEVVLANGDIVICDEIQNSDLFWAIRGAGSNFGPVTSFTFKAYPQRETAWSGLLIFPAPKLEAFFKAIQEWYQSAGEDEGANVFVARPPPDFKPALILLPFYNGSVEEGKKKFRAFYDVGPVADLTQEMPYPAVNTLQNPMATHGDRKLFKATTFTSFDPSRFQHIFDEYSKFTDDIPETSGSAIIIELYPHNKIASVPPTATAFANRARAFSLLYNPRWKDSALDRRLRAWATEQVEWIRTEENKDAEKAHKQGDGKAFQGSRGYSNYGLGDERPREVFGDNYDRLAQLKAKYDPGNVFHKWFPITPRV